MPRRTIVVSFLAALASACASVPPPVTRSPHNPAHPEAAEASTPPLSPTLMKEAEPGIAAPAASPDPHAMHQGHAPGEPGAEATNSAQGPYTCPMHTKVESDTPGTCPICGMTLVPKKPEGHKR
jgi:hypothetical protein